MYGRGSIMISPLSSCRLSSAVDRAAFSFKAMTHEYLRESSAAPACDAFPTGPDVRNVQVPLFACVGRFSLAVTQRRAGQPKSNKLL
jgi:hypothetical protein